MAEADQFALNPSVAQVGFSRAIRGTKARIGCGCVGGRVGGAGRSSGASLTGVNLLVVQLRRRPAIAGSSPRSG